MGGEFLPKPGVPLLALILTAAATGHSFDFSGQGTLAGAPAGSPPLEDGTPLRIRLSQSISSATAQVNDRINFDVLEEVKVGNLLVIPKGSIAWGTVTEAQAKRRMGRGGKLDVNIDSVRLADGEKAPLRGVKDVKGGGHTGAMTGGMVATGLVMWTAAPLFLLMHGKDVTIPEGTELTVYINGDFAVDPVKFGGTAAPGGPAGPSAAAVAPTIVLLDPAGVSPQGTIDVATSPLTLRGVVTDPSGIPAVAINGNPTSMLPKGPQAAEFSSEPIPLHAGDNEFEIVATNAAHLQAKFSFVAHMTSPASPPLQMSPRTNSISKALSQADIISLLKGGVTSARVAELVNERGITFTPTDDALKPIRAAGGSEELVASILKAKLHR